MFKKLGNFIGAHGRATLVASVVAIAVAGFYGLGLFGNLSHSSTDFTDKSSESYKAQQQIDANFSGSDADLLLLFEAKNGKTVDDGDTRQEIERLLAKVPSNVTVSSYFSTQSEQLVSTDRTKTFAKASIKEGKPKQIIADLRRDFKSDTVGAFVGGSKAINSDVNNQIETDLKLAETVSFAVLAVLLVIVFRSFVAAALPLLLGGVAILGAFFVTNVLTSFTEISSYAVNVIIMIGLGLAIDYSLFMVERFREELRAGQPVKPALTTTMMTAGRTVFFSGLTVILSLLSLLVFPLEFLRSMGLGGSAAVFVAMIAALVVLPAILRVLGHNINALSFGSAKRDRLAATAGKKVDQKQSIWYKTGAFFMRWPWQSIVVALGVLLVMGSPFLRAHFALPDYRSLPEGSEARLVSERLTRDFNVQTSPLVLTFTTNGPITEPQNIGKMYDFTRSLQKLDGVTKVDSITTLPQDLTREQYQVLLSKPTQDPHLQYALKSSVKDNLAVIEVRYKGITEDAAIQKLVAQIRDIEAPSDTTVLLGGRPAELYDLLASLAKYIPIGLAVIVVSLFVLLFLMLGSIVIPLKAILMNLLSLSAAYGAMVWIFQDGNLTSFLHLTQTGSLDATMPVLVFAVAFGLSMDYAVFLYSRIKEQYDKTGDNQAAVLAGLQKTGSIITSAALLLFVVVGAFATAHIPLMQQIGVGLAITVLVDAFLVRMVLVPALMKPLNKYNWWAPAALKRLQQKLGLGE